MATNTKKVLISTDYGAGWYSWTRVKECLTNPEIIALVEARATKEEIMAKAEQLWPGHYWGGARGLEVVEIPADALYRVLEYDGAERIELQQDIDWLI